MYVTAVSLDVCQTCRLGLNWCLDFSALQERSCHSTCVCQLGTALLPGSGFRHVSLYSFLVLYIPEASEGLGHATMCITMDLHSDRVFVCTLYKKLCKSVIIHFTCN